MEMFASDHLSHTNCCVCQSGNYLQSNSTSHAIKCLIMAAFNCGRQNLSAENLQRGKMSPVSILILNQVIFLVKLF